MVTKTRVGIAFQGAGFPAGALGAGVIKYLVEKGAFEANDIDVFSGTSSGALVASACWGHKLEGTMAQAPDTLEKQWLHFAWGLVPNAKVAQISQLADNIAQMNPVYRYVSDHMMVPVTRHFMKDWVAAYIPINRLIQLRDSTEKVPGLALGAAEVLKGEVKVFTENDFCLEAILASGSLDNVKNMTEIYYGPNQGLYLDGAWGTNPPINPMLNYGINQLWLVEAFPKQRKAAPATPGERKDRKDELWQNSLVEHELDNIERVNEWIKSGRLNNEDGRYRHIEVKRMPMTLDLPVGSALVNSESFIREMMDYGYENAQTLWAPEAITAA